MAKGKLLFPVGFDYSGAVSEKEIKATLDRVDRIIKSRPVVLSTQIDTKGLDYMKSSYRDTIDEIKKRISQLNEMWAQVSPAQMFNKAGTDFSNKVLSLKKTVDYDDQGQRILEDETTSVRKLYTEYTQIIELLQRFGKSLSQTHAERIKNINDEMRLMSEQRNEYMRHQTILAQLANERRRQAIEQKRLTNTDSALKQATDEYENQRRKVEMLKSIFDKATASRQAMEKAGTHKNADGTNTKAYEDALNREKQASIAYTDATKKLTSALSGKIAAEKRSIEQIERESSALKTQQDLIRQLEAAMRSTQASRGLITPNMSELEKANKAVLDQETVVKNLAKAYQTAKRERLDFDGIVSSKKAYDKDGYQTKAYQDALAKEKQIAKELLRAEEQLTSAMQRRVDVQMRTAEQARRDVVNVSNQISAIDSLKDRIQQLQNAQNQIGTHQNQFDNLTKKLKDQDVVVGLLRDDWKKARDERKAYESLGVTKNADNTANKDYIAALEKEKQLAHQLATEEQNLLNVQTQRLQMLRQIGLSGNIDTSGRHWVMGELSSAAAIDSQIRKYETLKARIHELGVEYERLKALHNADGTDVARDARAEQILRERVQLTKELAKVTQTADQAQAEYAKKQEAREKALQARIDRRIQRRRQEVTQMVKEANALKLEENTINNINRKLEAYRAKLSRMDFKADPQGFKDMQKEIVRLTELLQRLSGESNKAARNNGRQAQMATSEYKKQADYLSRLLERMAAYASVAAIGSFLSKVREVTAQFELQRVSLGAIIQDQVRANSMMTEIKAFALKTPVTIMQLVRYTKQVAAYRVETDKLFDTTKRLADVSVGLGVDMQRIVLAYGQVKAATYLRASELRQFTEAGIPMLELLAEKFSETEKHVVSTAEVMKRIHDRGVEFKDVEQIFNDMTSAGGMFYKMQEKQGNTLYGLWAKLGDAASIMYDEIGNWGPVNWAMKSWIKTLTQLMRSWKLLGGIISTVGASFMWIKIASFFQKMYLNYTVKSTAASEALAKAKAHQKLAQQSLNAATAAGNKTLIASLKHEVAAARQAQTIAYWNMRAAATTNIFARAWYNLRAALVGQGPMLWFTAITMLVTVLWRVVANMNKVSRALNEIYEESQSETQKSVENFKSLANTVAKATDGSKRQRDALEELHRTYKDMIPTEQLTIENLRSLKGNYDLLTGAIKEYIHMQMRQKAIDKVIETHSKGVEKKRRNLSKALAKEFGEAGAERYIQEFENYLNTGVKYAEAAKILHEEYGDTNTDIASRLLAYNNALENQEKDIQKVADKFEESTKVMGKFSKAYDDLVRQFNENPIYNDADKSIGLNSEQLSTYFGQQVKNNREILDVIIPTLKTMFEDVGAEWDDSFTEILETIDEQGATNISNIDFDAIYEALREKYDELEGKFKEEFNKYLEEHPNATTMGGQKVTEKDFGIGIDDIDKLKRRMSSLNTIMANYVPKLQKQYLEIAPSDRVVSAMHRRLEEFVLDAGESMNDFSTYLMANGKTQQEYRKELKDTIEKLDQEAASLRNIRREIMGFDDVSARMNFGTTQEELEDDIETMLKKRAVLNRLLESIPDLSANNQKTRQQLGKEKLQEWNEYSSIIETVYKKYKELQKDMSADQAADYIAQYYGESLDFLRENGLYLKSFPKDTEEYQRALRRVRDQLASIVGEYNLASEWAAKKHIGDINVKIGSEDIEDVKKTFSYLMKTLQMEAEQSKLAKNFFNTIFEQSHDYDLSMALTMSVYGEDGTNYAESIKNQLINLFSFDENNPIDISAAFGPDFTIDYTKLKEIYKQVMYGIPESYRSNIEKIINDGIKAQEDQAKQWIKDLATAKTYAQKRVELAKWTEEQIQAIQRSNLSDEAKKQMTEGYMRREAKEMAKLEYEAFKDSPVYTALFNNLEGASTSALKSMQSYLERLKESWSELDPTQLKELQSRFASLREELASRSANPFANLKANMAAIKKLEADMREDLKGEVIFGVLLQDLPGEIEKVTKMRNDTVAAFNDGITRQRQLEAEMKQIENDLKKKDDENIAVGGEDEVLLAQIKDLQQKLKLKKEELELQGISVDIIREELDNLDRITNKLQYWSNEYATLINDQKELWKGADKIKDGMKGVADAAAEFMGEMGMASDVIDMFKDIQSSMSTLFDFTKACTTAVTALGRSTTKQIKSVEKASLILAAITAAIQAATAVFNLFANAKTRAAERQIKREQALIDSLSYSYEKLNESADKMFGSDYLDNYNRRLEQLKAMQASYIRQAELERSKGKKKDKDKMNDYLDSARDAADKIAEMEAEVTNRLLGTDLASAAKDFAAAWRDAYIEFSNTADALTEKFNEMVKNMVVESLMAKVVEAQLRPFFDEIDALAEDGQLTAEEIASVVGGIPSAVRAIDDGLRVTVAQLQNAGLDIRNLNEDGFTGISRDIASASEESINGLAAMINTQNYYISHVPMIYEEIVLIRTLLSGGDASLSLGGASAVDLQNEYLSHLPIISSNTALIAERCEKAAQACEDIAASLDKVIKPRGVDAGWVVNTNI